METLHACLLLASKTCDDDVVEWCEKIVADDAGCFLQCERDGLLWNQPASWKSNKTIYYMLGLMAGVELPERLAVAQAATFYDGPGRVEVPTSAKQITNYISLLKT